MAFTTTPKMSLVAQFDDLRRYTKVLTAGCEEEFKVFVEGQLNVVRKWKEAEEEVKKLQMKISKVESEKSHLNVQMKHIRSLFEQEMIKRKNIEQEKNSMERQIILIKEVLLADGNMDNQTKEKLFQLSTCKSQIDVPRLETIEESIGSILSISDVDQTSDDLDIDPPLTTQLKRRSQGKRRSSGNRLSPKRRKSDEKKLSEDDVFTSEFCSDLPKTVGAFKSNSDPVTNSSDLPTPTHPPFRSDSEHFKNRTYDLRRYNTVNIAGSIPVGRYSTGGKLSRTHAFCTKTVIRAEKCYPCGRIIKFCKQALKCQDCRVTCHPECKDQCPVPCIPASSTPIKGSMGSIADYTTSTPPMIPSLIVHCVNEIECRGLTEIGLYRISGSEREVKDLKEKFLRAKAIPCLNQVDIHTLCGTVKEFLRSLKEPLVPRACWQNFVDAAENSNIELSLNLLYEHVRELPQPNRDTLAFLILHLQRIAQTPDCKMPTDNLAKVFGPTIVGYSNPEPSDSNIFNETKYQHKVMHRLLSINTDFWQNLLDIEADDCKTYPMSPECIPAPKCSRLGPIYPPSQKSSNKTAHIERAPITPRNSRSGTLKPGKRQFFSSPFVK